MSREAIEDAYRIALEPFARAESAAMRKRNNLSGNWIDQAKNKQSGAAGGRPRHRSPSPKVVEFVFRSARTK